MDILLKVNVRKRRSQRLGHKCPLSPKKECLQSTLLGNFAWLPIEIMHTLFSYLNVVDLSVLALTSKYFCEFIEEYRFTKRGKQKFLLDLDVHSIERTEGWPTDTIHSFFRLGLYAKRTSFLKSTSKRLKHVSQYLNENLICSEKCGDGRKCISFYCYGTFLHTLIAGWDDLECLRVLEFVQQNSPINRHVTKILATNSGIYPHLEVYVRCFYRRAFIDVLRKKEDKAFWLSTILKPYPMIHQARLLQILFLPKTSFGVNFNAAIYDRFTNAALADLGNAFQLLFEYAKWSDDNIISVFDETIGTPALWSPPNISALLLNCSPIITEKVLISKAINNRFSEIVCISHHLLVASIRATRSIKPASDCIWSFMEKLNPSDRVYLASQLLNSLKNALFDMVDMVLFDEGVEPITEVEAALEAISQFTENILNLALVSLRENRLSSGPGIHEVNKDTISKEPEFSPAVEE